MTSLCKFFVLVWHRHHANRFVVRSQILYSLNMDDSYQRKLSAYERRRINSQKIAQVQFEPKGHTTPQYLSHSPEQFKRETGKTWKAKTSNENVWTSKDQVTEEELWDE